MKTGEVSRATFILLLSLLPVACDTGTGRAGRDAPTSRDLPSPPFDSVFQFVGTLELDESGPNAITQITDFAVARDGRIAIADAKTPRVVVYNPDGDLERSVGRSGEGPGEYRNPSSVAFGAAGELYVLNVAPQYLIRFSADLAYDTTFRIDDALAALEVETLDKGLVVFTYRDKAEAPLSRLYSTRGQLLKTFYELDPTILSRPFWEAATDFLLTTSKTEIIAGYNLSYPLVRYDPSGTFVDSIGFPPPSWVPPPSVDPAGPFNTATFKPWRRRFTTIREIAVYRDSLLLVSHEKLDPEILSYEAGTYAADIYLLDGRKIWDDIPLPGRLLSAGQFVYVLLDRRPESTTVGEYSIRLNGLEAH